MSTSNTGSDLFEQRLRDSLAQYEVPYNSADWKDLERAMDSDRRGWWMGVAGLATITGIVTLVGGGIWFATSGSRSNAAFNNESTQEATTTSTEVAANTTTSSTSTPAAPAGDVAATTGTKITVEDGSSAQDGATSLTASDIVTQSRTEAPNSGNSVANASVAAARSLNSPDVDAPATSGAPNPERAFRASVSEACSGTSVQFKVEHMPENGIYLWNFGDGSFSNKANPEHTFTKPGRYQVMLSMSASGVGSIQNKPSSDVIEIHEAPSAAFNVLRQEYEGHLPSVHFENRSLGGETYAWDFGDGETSSIAHPDHIYKTKGVYQVTLTVTNAIGCEDQIMKDVRVDRDYNLDAPASFSPDGDGKEESFIPEALRSLGVKFNLAIYSPEGVLLYQTNDATKPWTGRPNNRGEICTPGEYVWVVDVRESLHLAETYTGKVKLER